MALPAQIVALLLSEHAREPFAGPVLGYGKQSTNLAYEDVLWLFEALGLQPHPDGLIEPPPRGAYVDLAGLVKLLGLGTVQTLDPNQPVPVELSGRFGLIVDSGAIEHVFDVRQAMTNVADLLRPGGQSVHISAVNNWPNRGLVQVSPTFYHDYYSANGFDDVRGIMVVQPRAGTASKRWHFFQYDQETLGGVNSMFCGGETQLAVYYTARKNSGSTSARVPLQSYFVRLNEGKDPLPFQFVVTYEPSNVNVRRFSDPESGPGSVSPFARIWTLDFGAG